MHSPVSILCCRQSIAKYDVRRRKLVNDIGTLRPPLSLLHARSAAEARPVNVTRTSGNNAQVTYLGISSRLARPCSSSVTSAVYSPVRRERCTRSIKRKSGPAKGTKYTTRRQRLEAGIIDPIVPPKGRGNKRATTRSTIPAAAARAAVRAGAGAAVGIAVDSPAANSGGPSRKTTDARGQHGTSTPATVVAPSTPPRLSSSDHLASPLVTGAAFGRAKAEQAVANMKSGSGGAGGRIATGRNAARPAAVVALGSGRGGGRGNGRGGRGVRGRGRPSRGGRGRGASTSSVVSGADTAARFASCGGGGNGGDAQFVDGNAPHALSAPQVVRGRSESRGGGSSGSGPIGASKSTRVVARRPMSLLCLPVLPWPSPSLPSAMPAAPPPGGGLGNTGDEEFHQVGRGRSTSPFGLLPPPPTLAGNKPRRGGTREPPVEAAGGQGHFWAAPGAPSSKRYRMVRKSCSFALGRQGYLRS